MKHLAKGPGLGRRIMIAYAAAGFVATAALMGGITSHAQSIASHDSRAPVSFDAARIEWQDRQKRVVLTGDVRVEQAGLALQSSRMLLEYRDAGELRIDRITANGGVNVTRGNERASGDTAIYDFNRRVITMTGNVRLRRGADTLNGGRLVIDLQSGLSSVDGAPAGASGTSSTGRGRVTGTFAVPQGKKD
ncbi:MAG: LptA/OstA family protein [Erythrobacter sp.]